ncbi:MAG: pentapeptide repeat-containing protein [Reyranellaceae bacterium]
MKTPSKSRASKGTAVTPRPAAATATPLFQPNMLVMNADLASSTMARVRHDHSVISESRYLNCLFSETNFEGSSFSGCDFDGCRVENASLRGVQFSNCDVEGLVINGVNISELLRQLAGR